jgi:hypothetical protein
MGQDFRGRIGEGQNKPSSEEVRRFAYELLGKPMPSESRAGTEARAEREHLQWLASIAPAHESRLRELSRAATDARAKREQLEWLAQISTRHESELRQVLKEEAEARERLGLGDNHSQVEEGEWDPGKHPRTGSAPNPGWFAYTDGEGGGASGEARQASVPSSAAAQPPVTKAQLPAERRGTWVSGTKGEGVFRYNDSAENHEKGVAGEEVRYENQHIATGGFPPEAYYGGSAEAASVPITKVTGTKDDGLAADAEMRKKLKDPNWQRPKGYRWNHAGQPGSTTMELVKTGVHTAVSHKGPAAGPRAEQRLGKARGVKGRAMGALTVYMGARDALQAGGILQPDYEERDHEVYHYRAEDGSVFVVQQGNAIKSAERVYVEGPRKGQTEKISSVEVEQHRKQAEEEFGRYIPGNKFKKPRFIPGRQRKTIPLITIDKYGVPYDGGYIDEDGPHYYRLPQMRPI